MQTEIFLALVAFSFVSSITPGPNNLMLLASGVNYGFARSLPHMIGIGSGFCILLLATGFGLGQLLERAPLLYTALKFAGAAYLLYLAWRIASSGPVGSQAVGARPMTLLEAAAFQWVNPKAWVMAVTSMAVYTNHDDYTLSVLLVALVFTVVNIPSVSVWCGMGVSMRRLLSSPKWLRIFNVTMALLLVASLWPMLR